MLNALRTSIEHSLIIFPNFVVRIFFIVDIKFWIVNNFTPSSFLSHFSPKKITLCCVCLDAWAFSYDMNKMLFLFTIYFHRRATYRFFPFHNVALKKSSLTHGDDLFIYSVFFFIFVGFKWLLFWKFVEALISALKIKAFNLTHFVNLKFSTGFLTKVLFAPTRVSSRSNFDLKMLCLFRLSHSHFSI